MQISRINSNQNYKNNSQVNFTQYLEQRVLVQSFNQAHLSSLNKGVDVVSPDKAAEFLSNFFDSMVRKFATKLPSDFIGSGERLFTHGKKTITMVRESNPHIPAGVSYIEMGAVKDGIQKGKEIRFLYSPEKNSIIRQITDVTHTFDGAKLKNVLREGEQHYLYKGAKKFTDREAVSYSGMEYYPVGFDYTAPKKRFPSQSKTMPEFFKKNLADARRWRSGGDKTAAAK